MTNVDHSWDENDSVFGPKLGTWRVHSDSDPRWNKSGRDVGFAILGGPESMKAWIDECMAKYGEAPKDATQSFWKD